MKETKVTFKKIVLSIFMCLALAIVALPMGKVEATGVDPTKAPAINFDTNQKGNIYIHKYEYNPTTPTPTPVVGTGEANQTTPGDATALENVGFTIYKIADADALKAYYGISSTTTYDPTTYCELVEGKYVLKDDYKDSFETKTATTNDAGLATFPNLDLGIYLVIETTVPDKVTSPVVPFLVSVPMTTSSGDDWLYDVHVYPKNRTTYGGVKLKKLGDSDALLSGVQFVIQKKKTDGTYATVTKNDKNEDIGTNGVLTTANGVIEVTNLSPGEYRFIETDIGGNYGYILDGVTAYTFTINNDSSIDYGTTVTVSDTTSGTAETYIKVVNEKPDVTKKVLNSSGTAVKETDYSVGDTISYKITVKVPSNVEQLRTFEVKDTPTNIAYTKGTLKVYNSDKSKTLTAGTHYTIDDTTTQGAFTLSFKTTVNDGIKDAGKEIIIEYDAVLQDTAVTTAGGNSNTVNLKYENEILPENREDGNPNPTKAPTSNDTYEIEDSATVYTFKVKIEKTGENNAKLSGVKFDLYKQDDANGTVTGDAAKALGLDSAIKWKKIETLTTETNGTISTQGLANGVYYLVETETNDGYNLLAKPLKVELKAEYTTNFKATTTEAAKTIKNEIGAATSTLTEKMEIDSTAQSNFTVQIKNSKGFTLPTTGGAGSFLFTLIGCTIMIGGFIIFRKTNAKKSDAA